MIAFKAYLHRAFANIIQAILVLSIPVLLVILNVRIVMSPQFLYLEYTRIGFPEDSYGFTTSDRIQYGTLGIRYLLENQPATFLSDLTLSGERCYPPGETPCHAFNPLEVSHMVDVQVVTTWTFRTAFVLISFWMLCLLAKKWIVRGVSLRSSLIQGSLLTIALIIAIILVAVIAWDHFFTQFHKLFFADGTWQFYYSDTLIRLYPQQFWFDAALVVGTLTICEALVILGVEWYKIRRKL